ncbi:MAG: response regulator [Chloroflexota bacterium]
MRDYPAFVHLVHEVYPRLHDRAFLRDHPLTGLLSGGASMSAERLHRTLIDAIEWLRPIGVPSPSSVEWRRYSHLQSRYLEGASPEHIARELQVSPRQARRDHAEALDELARLLWSRFGRAITPSSDPEPARARPAPLADSLDAEISSLNAAASAQPTDAGELITGVVATVSRLAEANAVAISIGTPGSVESIVVNRTALRQLLLHLLSESIVNRPGGSIRIEVARLQLALAIQIGVTGGVRPTRRLDDPIAPNEAAPGVWTSAIAVGTRLARSLGATLQSDAQPAGDSVTLTLPIRHGVTLLVVDDNPDVALLFRRYLADTTYRLVQARSAERALRLARELRPEIVILDVLLPSHDGWEILQALRVEPATARIPVVICSVVPDHALAYSLGVSDFLTKPVTRPALLEVLARLTRPATETHPEDPRESNDTTPPRAARRPG